MKIKQIETKQYLGSNLNNPQFIKSTDKNEKALIFKDDSIEKYIVMINDSDDEYSNVSPLLNSIEECENWN